MANTQQHHRVQLKPSYEIMKQQRRILMNEETLFFSRAIPYRTVGNSYSVTPVTQLQGSVTFS